jgi:mono/diheme cytochrome c family protein
VNRQINYIIHAFLLVLLLAAGYFVINKIISAELIKERNDLIDYDPVKPDSVSVASSQGKTLFLSKCASCHHIFKDMTGPALRDFEKRGPWSDRKKLYEWVKNPEVFMKNDPYTKQLKEKFGSVMTAFPSLTTEEIDAITKYVTSSKLVTPL